MFHIMSDNPPVLQSVTADCTEELSNIVGKMLAKKADDRYQSMDDILRDLDPLWKCAQQAAVAGLLSDRPPVRGPNDLERGERPLRKGLQSDTGNTPGRSVSGKRFSELSRSPLLPTLKA